MRVENNWFDVFSIDFDNIKLGSVFGNSSNVIGRKLDIDANEIKSIKSKPGYKIIFRIESADGEKLNARIESLVMSREQISRMVRHNISKLDVVTPVNIEGKDYFV